MVVFTGVVFVFRSEIIMQFLSNQDAYDIAYYALVIQCVVRWQSLLVSVPICCFNQLVKQGEQRF